MSMESPAGDVEMSGRPRLRPWREFFGGFASVTPAQRK